MALPSCKKAIQIMTFALLAGTSALAIPAAQAQDGSDLNATQKEAVRSIIKEYLMKEPEIVIEAMEAYQIKKKTEEAAQTAEKISEYETQFQGDDFPVAGNENGDVTIVEFFDYNCGYCKRAFPDVQAVLEEDDNVRIVFVEMPILGPTSLTASQWALASKNQDKYFEYHTALMNFRGEKTEENLANLAAEVGLDVDQMKKDAESPEVLNKITESRRIATDIGVQGTPAFIIGGEFYPGYIGEDAMKDSIQSVRDGQSG